jgi:hypothetical protein
MSRSEQDPPRKRINPGVLAFLKVADVRSQADFAAKVMEKSLGRR